MPPPAEEAGQAETRERSIDMSTQSDDFDYDKWARELMGEETKTTTTTEDDDHTHTTTHVTTTPFIHPYKHPTIHTTVISSACNYVHTAEQQISDGGRAQPTPEEVVLGRGDQPRPPTQGVEPTQHTHTSREACTRTRWFGDGDEDDWRKLFAEGKNTFRASRSHQKEDTESEGSDHEAMPMQLTLTPTTTSITPFLMRTRRRRRIRPDQKC